MTQAWLALVIGNTRLHWGFFQFKTLKSVWHTPHLTAENAEKLIQSGFQASGWRNLSVSQDYGVFPSQFVSLASLWVASAVPQQTGLWQMPPSVDNREGTRNTTPEKSSEKGPENGSSNIVERSRIPLQNLYPTLGIDRAINLLGAGNTLGWPVLVIDSGTALTFTAGVEPKDSISGCQTPAVYGGAILPGLRLQRQALLQQTADLGAASSVREAVGGNGPQARAGCDQPLPVRWATDTAGAIASGLAYGATATVADYLTDWWQQFPKGKAVLTGGDGPLLHQFLKHKTPAIAARVQVDSHLMFWGMRHYHQTIGKLSQRPDIGCV